jgi:hypothetical protein
MVATPALEPDPLAGETPSTHPVVHRAAQNPVLVQDRVGQAADTRYSFLVLRSPTGADGDGASYPLRPFLKRRPADKAGLFKPKHGQPSEQDREPRNITEPHTR